MLTFLVKNKFNKVLLELIISTNFLIILQSWPPKHLVEYKLIYFTKLILYSCKTVSKKFLLQISFYFIVLKLVACVFTQYKKKLKCEKK